MKKELCLPFGYYAIRPRSDAYSTDIYADCGRCDAPNVAHNVLVEICESGIDISARCPICGCVSCLLSADIQTHKAPQRPSPAPTQKDSGERAPSSS